jgi:predicted transcriptional regulator of viral defense system
MPPRPARPIDARILATLQRRGAGTVFVPSEFLGLGTRTAIDVALHRLVARGAIRRLGRGVYDFPKRHRVLGEVTPSADAIAAALAGRDRLRLQPSGAYAANLLGLSEQVPAKVVFLTDGATRTAGRLSGLVIQALRSLGRRNITPQRIAHLKRSIPAADRRVLIKDLRFAPAWMHPIFRELVGGGR